eukprot:m.342134 g.342134  ORF g.342134 m.342134 type:complete len:1486 (+) comp21012_c0_seq1:282-4739(+)
MEESLVFAGLAAPRYQERSSAIEAVRAGLRRSGRLKIHKVDKFFKLLSDTLRDTNWNVRRDSIALIAEVVSKSGTEVDMQIILLVPYLVHNLGDTKVTIRRGAMNAIEACYEHTKVQSAFTTSIIQEGIENKEKRVRNETLRFLERSTVWQSAQEEEIFLLVKSVIGRLRDVETEVLQSACRVISIVPGIIGERKFSEAVKRLPPMLRQLYDTVNKVRLQQEDVGPSIEQKPISTLSRQESAVEKENDLCFGYIPPKLLSQLKDSSWEVRKNAVDTLKNTTHNLERTSAIIPYLNDLIKLLLSLVGDTNLKITLTAIEILEQLIEKVGWPMRSHLESLVNYQTNLLGDMRIVVRQASTKLLITMMQSLTPPPVLEVLLPHIKQENWRVREEIINVVILALTTFQKEQLDLHYIVSEVGSALNDKKQRVKALAMQAFASIEEIIGYEALGSLMRTMGISTAKLADASDTNARPNSGKLMLQQDLQQFGRRNSTSADAVLDSASTINRRRGSLRSRAGTSSAGTMKLPWNDPGSTPETDSSYTPSPASAASRRQRASSYSGRSDRSYADMYRSKINNQNTPKESDLAQNVEEPSSPFPAAAMLARPSVLRRVSGRASASISNDFDDKIEKRLAAAAQSPVSEGESPPPLLQRNHDAPPMLISRNNVPSPQSGITQSGTSQTSFPKRNVPRYKANPKSPQDMDGVSSEESQYIPSPPSTMNKNQVFFPLTMTNEPTNEKTKRDSEQNKSAPEVRPGRARSTLTSFDESTSDISERFSPADSDSSSMSEKRRFSTVASPRIGSGSGKPQSPRSTGLTEFEASLIAKAQESAAPNFSRSRSPVTSSESPSERPISGVRGTRTDSPKNIPKRQTTQSSAGRTRVTNARPKARRPSSPEQFPDATQNTTPTTPTPRPPRGARTKNTPTRKASTASLNQKPSGQPTGRSTSNPAEQYLLDRSALPPYDSPSMALKNAQIAIKKGATQETWIEACEGLTIIRQMLCHNKDMVVSNLSAVITAVVGEIMNLRSQVARLAILLMGDLFEVLQKGMHDELEKAVGALFKKLAAESSSIFIKEEIDATMTKIVACVRPSKALLAVITGTQHKAAAVRRLVGETLAELIRIDENMLQMKEVERLFSSLVRLLEDNDPTVRYAARKAFYLLQSRDSFDTICRRCLSDAQGRKVSGVVAKLREQGLGEPPLDPKARMSAGRLSAGRARRDRRSSFSEESVRVSGSAGSERSSGSAPTNRKNASPRRAHSRALPKMSTEFMENLEDMIGQLGSSDWKIRETAVLALDSLIQEEGENLQPVIVKIFDAFGPRLCDSNSKVGMRALETLCNCLPHVKEAVGSNANLATEIITKLSGNLISKSQGIRDNSCSALSEMCNLMDATMLIKPFVNIASKGSAPLKQSMVQYIVLLSDTCCDINPNLVKRCVIPFAGQLSVEKKHTHSCELLCVTLLNKLGAATLRESLTNLPPQHKKALDVIIQQQSN